MEQFGIDNISEFPDNILEQMDGKLVVVKNYPLSLEALTVKFLADINFFCEISNHNLSIISQIRCGSDLEFIKPTWYDDSELYTKHLQDTEEIYKALKPEQVRYLLPLSTATDLVVTGYIGHWNHLLWTTTQPETIRLLEPVLEYK